MEKEKVISIEDRIPKLKQARQKRANRKLLFYLSIFFLLITIIIYLQSPLSNVKEVDITGNEVVHAREIMDRSGLSKDTNIWTVNSTRIAPLIMEHPMIESVDVQRQLPNKVLIQIKEHAIVGFIKDESTYFPILSTGEIVQTANHINNSEGPLLSHFTEEEFLQRMAKELHDTPNHIYDLISEIYWEPTESNRYKIMIYMNDGFVVQGTIRNFAQKMKAYPSIVSQLDSNEKGIVHMGVGTYFEKLDKESEMSLQEVPISE